MSDMTDQELYRYLMSPEAIRERCQQIYQKAICGNGLFFRVHEDRISKAVDYVWQVIQDHYPSLDVPYHSRWRHLEAGGIERLAPLRSAWATDDLEWGRVCYDLIIPSILVDAGAGEAWSFIEDEHSYQRSEGLALAALALFRSGALQENRPADRIQTTAKGLTELTSDRLGHAFQVSTTNPLIGLEGRCHLLNQLGEALRAPPAAFGDAPRLGLLFDRFLSLAKGGKLNAKVILQEILRLFSSIWPGRLNLDGKNLGDTWRHPGILGARPDDQFVPFHKLSQWLCYSLLEPLEQYGIQVSGLELLTGLPEYRNGGLLLDLGVIELKSADCAAKRHLLSDPIIIEWRALTVVLLDRLAEAMRSRYSATRNWPLAKFLQGGTWTAGRKIASEMRPGQGGAPPLMMKSDGTIF